MWKLCNLQRRSLVLGGMRGCAKVPAAIAIIRAADVARNSKRELSNFMMCTNESMISSAGYACQALGYECRKSMTSTRVIVQPTRISIENLPDLAPDHEARRSHPVEIQTLFPLTTSGIEYQAASSLCFGLKGASPMVWATATSKPAA